LSTFFTIRASRMGSLLDSNTRTILLAAVVLAAGGSITHHAGLARAAAYTWSGDAGDYWNTATYNTVWSTGSSFVAWSNTASNTAVFATAPMTVPIDAPVTVRGMTFNVDGFEIFTSSGDAITLAGGIGLPTISVAAGATAMIDAYLAGSSGLTKSGNGTLELDLTNSYSGSTTVSGGVLRLLDPNALPGGTYVTGGTGNLVISGGVVELGAADFTRGLGIGPSQVQFIGGGGFSAYGGNRVVNLGGTSAQVTWGASSFVPAGQSLMLGSASDTATVDFQNPINLGSTTRTVQVTSGYATLLGAPDAQLSGALSGTGGLTITGGGVLGLSASNGYTGATTVSDAILRLSSSAALPGSAGASSSGSNLVLDGGVLELASTDFTRGLGTNPGQVQFTVNGGGFSASGANHVVNLSNSASLTWGVTGGFLPNGAPLILGSPSDTATVIFQNPVDLGNATRTIEMSSSGYATVDARLSGTLSGSGTGGLTITGYGVLELTATNTYTGATTVSGGILRLSNSTALPGGTGAIGGLGSLVLDGGVVELASTDFTRGLGSGQGQAQFTANGGGFSAYGANHVVNFSNSAALTWGATNGFLPSGAPLMLGSPSDNATLIFQNPINLGTSGGTVQITGGYATLYGLPDARLSGALSGTSGLTITGYGVLDLTASNTYTGATTISGGVLRLSNSAALPGGTASTGGISNLVLNGGVIELATTDFTRSLGTGQGQARFTANGGGFSAYGANRVVNFSNSAALTWGVTSAFLPAGAPLLLGSPSDNATLVFQNPINLGSSGGTVQVTSGFATLYGSPDARLSGVLSGTSGLTLTGYGELELTASNTYTGATTVSGGVLRLSNSAALPGGTAATASGSNLVLNGGVVELASTDFTRGMGTGPGQVQFTVNGGGFSASGANHVVNFSNSASLTWGVTSGFLPSGAPLLFGSPTDNATLIFQNPINLGSSGGTVQGSKGLAEVDAQLSGVLSGTSGLTLTGFGVLEMTASNTYTGATTVSGGVLRLSNSAALPGGTAATATGSNLVLNGGVIELASTDFTRTLGTGPGQAQFTANGGGFSAAGTDHVVNFSNSATLTWGGTSGFLPSGGTLMLGSVSDTATLIFQNPINLGGTARTIEVTSSGSASVDAQLSGALSGAGTGGLTLNGDGVLALTASNSYTGATTVSGGVLRLTNSGALPGGTAAAGGTSNLVLDGGVVELASTDFTRSLGGGPSQVQFTTNGGGFSASGTNHVVNISNSAALTWGGTSGFLPSGGTLMLGSPSDSATLDFQNPINMGSAIQTVQVTSGSATVDARLSGALSGSGGLTIAGGGVLELTASNSYTGPTTVSGGVLRLSNSSALPGGTAATATGSNLLIDGGVIELGSSDFTRSLGTGPGQVQFSASGGGFSAVGANHVVNLSNSATLTWGGTSSFLPSGGTLLLGSPDDTATLIFQNPINLGNGTRIVDVFDGNAAVDAQFSGVLSGSGGLLINGGGVLELTAGNTYTGGTTVQGGTLILDNNAALADGTSLIVGPGAAFPFNATGNARQAIEVSPALSSQASVVPEPGAPALLAAALWLAVIYCRRSPLPPAVLSRKGEG
jgi:fibronectin-binding autotransporter adhesin